MYLYVGENSLANVQEIQTTPEKAMLSWIGNFPLSPQAGLLHKQKLRFKLYITLQEKSRSNCWLITFVLFLF